MFKATLTQAAPVSDPFPAGPFFEGDDFNTAYIRGTFDGGTVTLEACPLPASHPDYDANNDWFTVPDISITAKSLIQPGVKASLFRWRLSGAGASASVIVRHLTMARVVPGAGV